MFHDLPAQTAAHSRIATTKATQLATGLWLPNIVKVTPGQLALWQLQEGQLGERFATGMTALAVPCIMQSKYLRRGTNASTAEAKGGAEPQKERREEGGNESNEQESKERGQDRQKTRS